MNEMIGQILTLARADSDRPAVSEAVRPGARLCEPLPPTPTTKPARQAASVRVRTLGGSHCSRRCGAARQRHRERRPKRMPVHAVGHVGRYLARRHVDARPYRRARSRSRSAARARSSGSSCRSTASALRAIVTQAAQDWACRSPLARSKCTADQSTPSTPQVAASKSRSTFRFTKLYRRFPFLDGTPSRRPLLWLC